MDIGILDPAVSAYLNTALWAAVALVAFLLLRRYMGAIIELFTNPYKTEEQFWLSLLTGHKPGVPMYFMRNLFALCSCRKRCKVCNMPFDGISAVFLKVLWSGESHLTPFFCKKCEDFARKHLGGAEICMTMLFVDMRNSTGTGEHMKPGEFRELLNRFYTVATDTLTSKGAWIDKFVGDEAIGLYIPGFAGKEHAWLALKSASDLLEATGHGSAEGPWIPLGIGINTGTAFMGSVGSGNVTDITALGDEVNLAARLSSEAGAGEIVFSDKTYQAIQSLENGHDEFMSALGAVTKTVNLKGKSSSQTVYVAAFS